MNSVHYFVLITALLVSGCGKPKIESLSASSIVVAFGDSLTAGYGVTAEKSYPFILSGLLGCKVVNSGISGEVTSEGLERLEAVLEKHNPDLVILCFGGNDMLQGKSLKDMALNLEFMIKLMIARDCEILLIGVPRPTIALAVPRVYEELADTYDLPYDGTTLRSVLSTASLTGDDLIHPNNKGYQRMAEAFLSLIRESEE